MRALALAVTLAVINVTLLGTGCRATPAWDPIGGFELVPESASGRDLEARELEHWLADARARLAPIADYTATLETRERIEDDLYPRRVLAIRVREKPFAVAAETLEPGNEKGQRVWYDETQGRGKMLAETPGLLGSIVGRVSLDPEGELAMENRRHPLTDLGLARLLAQAEETLSPLLASARPPRARLTEVADGALRVVDLLVPQEYPDPPLVHRLGFDAATGLLTYYGEAELLPEGTALIEEYLYRDVRTNLGLGSADFRPAD
jgi:hypothetical protein